MRTLRTFFDLKEGCPQFLLLPVLFLFQGIWQGINNHPLSYQSWTNYNYNLSQSSLERLIVTQRDERTVYRLINFYYKNRHNCKLGQYSFHYNEHVNEIQQLSVTTIQPFHQMYRNVSCLVFLLSNLAYPQWVSVDCNKPMVSDVACVLDRNDTKQAKKMLPQKQICLQMIYNNRTCFSFLPFNGTLDVHHPTKISLSIFRLLIKAVGKNLKSFLNINPSNASEIQRVTYKHTWQTFEVTAMKPLDAIGFYINQDHVVSVQIPTEILFRCVGGHFVSMALVCDSVSHCNDQSRGQSSDESFCDCRKQLCKKTCLNNRCKCSPLFYKSIHNICSTYLFETHTTPISEKL